MNLKAGDRILSVNQKPIHSRSDLYESLRSTLKKSKPFQVRLKRGDREISLSYRSKAQGNGKYQIKMLNKSLSRKTASQIKNSPPSKTKTLVPEKYKPYMQRAYISRQDSFVYSQPSFDATKLQALPIGKLVLISRKVFLPPHSFGSFYRIFLFREKKLVGYVSEAEVIPEFIKKEDDYHSNPSYKKAKLYKSKKQILKIQDIEDTASPSNQVLIQTKEKKRFSLKTKFKKYIGLSLGYSPYLNIAPIAYESLFLGLKLSVYDHKIFTDFNLNFYREKASADILAGFPAVKSKNYSLFFMGGGRIQYFPFSSDSFLDQIDYGPAGGASLLFPFFNKKLLLKLETTVDYQIRNQRASLNMLSAFQLSF